MAGQTLVDSQHAPDLSATDFYELANDRLSVGELPASIVQEFVARGLEPEDAGGIVARVEATRVARHIATGRRNMVFGGSAVLVAASVTAITFAQVFDSGGYFVIFPIATVFGAIQFVVGWCQTRMA